MKLYEVLAAELAASIHSGALRTGEKLPSVRQVTANRGVSASTVFQAYYLLEAQGLVRARERSGYYVSHGARLLPPEADTPSEPEDGAASLDISDKVFEVLESVMTREVVPFGSAFPSPLLFPMERLSQALGSSARNLDPWSTVDDLTPGYADLRRQIALRYLASGLHVHTDEIVITNGALEALNLCLEVVTQPGDAVLIETPTFYAALQSLERLQLEAVEVPTHPREGIQLDAMERAIERHRPKACWLMTTFQNPLGSLMSDEKKQALVEMLARHEVPLIEDDVYGELYFGNKRPALAKSFDRTGIVMHCSSFSKSLAPGYRVGWAAPGRYMRTVARRKLTTTLACPVPTQMALAHYLEKGGYDKHLRRLRKALQTQQTVFAQAIGHYFPIGTRATRPAGGYFLWVEMPDGVNALEIHRQALSHGISVAPGPIFSAKRAFSNCLRLNYGHAWDARSEAALATLGRLVELALAELAGN
ncbi:aminotransferase-like domain-containing protein [Eoetvoesiella caeni]|uniref:GntR family transcriptional regulator n=1 Tax=Eoetvoesiella caeni TaxID=645616 RepID=A0A366H0Z3_9BURK|nr:PLP-dependent aminotransferase family protein [Eoetvoesiella caeni]MCI2811083.1 PLP-dependent aminotransferase family protein [Eoetvoesiella caeni]NYT57005.1 PLP-dependent aminotransferase family protein [Eoetvoesiella caeni]RBP35167.1 GntR family transcriptional regulator [Eoetvoesiella caeni]